MFCTCSNGVRVPAGVVESALEGFVHLEYYQDVVEVNGHSKIDSISFAIPSSYSPCHVHPALDLHLVGGF